MIVATVMNGLGNQMFAYASVKAIALDAGYEFKYIYEAKLHDENTQLDKTKDTEYGNDLNTVFMVPETEYISKSEIGGLHPFVEQEYLRNANDVYIAEATQIKDNCIMVGHFMSPKYFYHRINEVRSWYNFPENIKASVKTEIENIRTKHSGKKLVAVQIRAGKDYLYHGFLLDTNYWLRAAEVMKEKVGEDCIFILFNDEMAHAVRSFCKKNNVEQANGSLVHDMCMMSMCDHMIISNSSFGIWGALLNKNHPIIIRPSIYPCGPWSTMQGVFLAEWEIVNARRNFLSFAISAMRIGKIRRKLMNIIHYKNLRGRPVGTKRKII